MELKDFVTRGMAAQKAADSAIGRHQGAAEAPLSPLAEALKQRYFEYAGRQHVGAHLPETWEALAKEALSHDAGLGWLLQDLRKTDQYLRSGKPKEEGVPGQLEFMRGLRETLDWVIRKCECEVEWQGLRRFLGDSAPPDLPEHSSSLEVGPKKGDQS